MNNIFTLNNLDDELHEKINIDELYEKKRQADIRKLELFKKMLARCHKHIKTYANQHKQNCCWFPVPETMIGVPRYNHANCVTFLINALQENGFCVKYYVPNMLFITWNHWVPSYVRQEIKLKLGIDVNEFGEKIQPTSSENEDDDEPQGVRSGSSGSRKDTVEMQQIKNSKKYTPIHSYRPSGKLVYSDEVMNTLENRLERHGHNK